MFKIYTQPSCSYCTAAKNLLSSKGLPFVEIDITNEAAKSQMLTEVPGARTVPQIFKNDTYIGGYEALVEQVKNDEQSTHVLFG
jgi:glutaredoxin 3